MGLIREPLDVDLYVDPWPLTNEEEQLLSDYVKANKLERTMKAEWKSITAKPSRLMGKPK